MVKLHISQLKSIGINVSIDDGKDTSRLNPNLTLNFEFESMDRDTFDPAFSQGILSRFGHKQGEELLDRMFAEVQRIHFAALLADAMI